MSLYKEAINGLRSDDYVTELFRFQGTGSFDYFNISTSRFNDTPNDSYVYFSKSLDHHKYFTVKRLKQLLNGIVLADSSYQISRGHLGDTESYNTIRNLIINSECLTGLHSIRLICDRNFSELISENCFMTFEKKTFKPIERVDSRVYGGGYGIASEWKDLLSYLTYFSAYQKIDRYDILGLLTNMRKTGKVNQKENITFLLSDFSRYNYELSPFLESDFTKYKIMECLEVIMEKEIYLPGSELGVHPTRTIRKVVNGYEKSREKVLTLFQQHSLY